jgi:hypothetical protein
MNGEKQMNFSSMSLTERLRYGSVNDIDPEEIETAARKSEAFDNLEIENQIQEMKAGFPEEDFMDALIDRMRDLANAVRGKNKEIAETLLQEAEQLKGEVIGNAEYAADIGKRLVKEINGHIEGETK